jgi:hypothetical protein
VLYTILTRSGIVTGLYTGCDNTSNRAETLASFKGPNMTVLLLSKSAGGTGLNMYASDLVMLNPGNNQSIDDQVKSRIVRLGQTHDVTIHHLVLPGMDTYMWNRKKQKLAISSLFVKDDKKTLEGLYNCSVDDINSMINKHRDNVPREATKAETKKQKAQDNEQKAQDEKKSSSLFYIFGSMQKKQKLCTSSCSTSDINSMINREAKKKKEDMPRGSLFCTCGAPPVQEKYDILDTSEYSYANMLCTGFFHNDSSFPPPPPIFGNLHIPNILSLRKH